MAVEEGKRAPAFTLVGDDGEKHKLSDHKGEKVVLYFYPKDMTPGCTTQACDFRDNLARVQAAGAVVYGVSKDSLESHDKFRDEHGLNFVLLSDPELKVHERYGAYGEKKMYGKTVMGVIRSTFLIDEQGKVQKAWRNVRAKGHVEKVLAELEA
ncbi:MAG: thioredoxin-dependent thiol peroxidase [Myxococcota bacterium]